MVSRMRHVSNDQAGRAPARAAAPAPVQQLVKVHIGGLTCASDGVRLEHLIRDNIGVIDVFVNPITEIAYITIDSTLATPELIRRWIDATVYGPVTR
jgi:hypothetical protein